MVVSLRLRAAVISQRIARPGRARAHLDRDLIGRTTDAAAADLDLRLHVVQRIVEQLDRIGLGAGVCMVSMAP